MTVRHAVAGDPSDERAGHLFLTVDFRPMVGGIAQYLHGLAGALAERDPVEVVAYGVAPEGRPRRAPYRVRHPPSPERRLGDRWGDAVPPLRLLNSALHHRRVRADATRVLEEALERGGRRRRVYVGVWSRAAHWWCRRLRREGIPYALFAYGYELRRDPGPIWRRRRGADVRGARRVIACSEATASLVRDRYVGTEPESVRPGISEPDDLEGAREAARRLRRELGIPDGARVLATVGRLVRRKGVDRVLVSLASGALDDPAVRYVVAGSGPERDRLEEMARELGLGDRVHFLGRVDEPTKWAVHALADVFVMPCGDRDGGQWEGFGIVFLEAAVLGVPSVAGASGGAAEAVEHGRTGLVVEPDSGAELQEALRELLSDEARRREMGRHARERARRDFSWERAADEVRAGWED